MKQKFKEWLSVFIVKNPARAILLAILFFNFGLLMFAAILISALSSNETGFFESIYKTITMILDAGCIDSAVEIGKDKAALVVICLVTTVIGMITFTGAIIGYVTNYISSFIENSESGNRTLNVSNHTVILNWNSRASEIINDLLYTRKKETIVILVQSDAQQIKKEIDERLSLTIKTENRRVLSECSGRSLLKRCQYIYKNSYKNNLIIIVREGDTYSTKQLYDISLLKAKTVIILGRDIQNSTCKYELADRIEKNEKGNSNTIKTLIQVAEITGLEESLDNQVIIVEIDDDWTANIVDKIISHKERLGKSNIVPVPVNRILGEILSQFSIMPELNSVYGELFSNKGAEFFCGHADAGLKENEYIENTLANHFNAIPLTMMKTKTGDNYFYLSNEDKDYDKTGREITSDYKVKVNRNYWLEQRNIVIVGHNSNCVEIMDGFNSFRSEWNFSDGTDILNVIVIDDKKSLEKKNYYKNYPYVRKTIEADIFDGETIKREISKFVDENEQDTSVLILSDDAALSEDIDANALTYLIYVQDVIREHVEAIPDFDKGRIDVIVEIVNPKNYDIVHSYSVNNVIISNRYVSKLITQISTKEALYEFYKDVLTYDDADSQTYESKEIYIKKVKRLFDEVPGPCTVAEFIRALYDATPKDDKTIAIGYVRQDGEVIIFDQNQLEMKLNLTDKDKVIVFCNH